jgi:predicted TIM-barrel fold metal-dependent hydrolase
VIDCDVHNATRSKAALKPYLASRWHDAHDHGHPYFRGLKVGAPARPSVYRIDAFPDEGPAGSDLALLGEQLLDRYGIRRAIVHPIAEILQFPQEGELGLALASALNDWMVAEWLHADDRIYGAISVPVEDGNLAAEEIDRASADPRFVKVTIPAMTRDPLGHSKYWPIYEVAVAHGLPIAAHVGGFSGTEGGSGPGSFFMEQHSNLVQTYNAQAVSLIASGVFSRFPGLKVILEEGGLAWLPPLLWRLDRTWEEMREDVPHLEERPSEIARRHFWLTTQPLDEPGKPEHLAQLLEMLDMNDRLLFATDYPHWDFDDPNRVLPASVVGASVRKQILSTNAEALFRFEPAAG